jgi:uncharacterized protein (DUF4415 family)
MKISFDPAKRAETLRRRRIDFLDTENVFAGPKFTFPDERLVYPEPRYFTIGLLAGRIRVVVRTPTANGRRIISMIKANDREKRVIHTDLAKLDAHEVQPEEYEDIPELTDEFFDNAEIRLGERLIRPARRPGRPQSKTAKKLVSLRLDPDIIERFRATGPGWQSRINAALREYLEKG